jgi:hypothetical protein
VLILGGLAFVAIPASATIGNTNCPHGNETDHFNSSACQLGLTIWEIRGDLTYTSQVYNYVGGDVRTRITLFGGSPCDHFAEGGIDSYRRNSTNYQDAYSGWLNGSGFGEYHDTGSVYIYDGVSVRVLYQPYYGSSAQVFETWVDGTPMYQYGWPGGIGVGACKAEGGMVAVGGALGDFFILPTDTVTVSNPEMWGDSYGSYWTSWSDNVVDKPCSVYSPAYCMNGSLYYSNTVYQANISY